MLKHPLPVCKKCGDRPVMVIRGHYQCPRCGGDLGRVRAALYRVDGFGWVRP